ncbi:MAG: hypothetical protein ACD_3C00100G0013 [uncultured bacterium (gcode 4)]|uniref:YCII-related domain-containing protein n=1 Tax=uncultured bacterium (gcode 4) TaxID=1234023 RepID=K2FYV5_9BACT|nr:MAG: hypothetical protein ACD_3C00100G0013 [uncultured bacterium (gcode 4)]
MKKFALIMIGYIPPTSEIMESWIKWFKSIEDKIEARAWFGNWKEITKHSITDLPMDLAAITGYMVIKVESEDEAEKIAQSCPMITSVKLYEIRSHQEF